MDAAPLDQRAHNALTREAYDRLAPVWAATTDDGPYNGMLERPALRSLVPRPLDGKQVLDAGCGSGAQSAWLLDEGADVTGIDLSPRMVDEARRRCGDRGRFFVADLAEPLALEPASLDGITSSLALHYVRDWSVLMASLARLLRPGGWVVASVDHPFAPPMRTERRGYFDTALVSDSWDKAGVEVTQHFWRRPLGAVLDASAGAGFVLDRVVEARPSPEAIGTFPELAEEYAVPSFIVYRFWLRN